MKIQKGFLGLFSLSAKSYQLKAVSVYVEDSLEKCVQKAMEIAQNEDFVLFSPAFASFGKWFRNEYDRGEQFVKLVKSL
ncbi:MAG: hypothetical protein Q7S86_04800 [bacterium]|nr:hypothetical protein [bacterium]